MSPPRSAARSPLPAGTESAARTFIDGVGKEFSALWGRVPDLAGRIFAALYLAGRPLDMEELAALLGRSKSNISVNLRVLLDLGLVTRPWNPGARRETHAVADDYGNVILRAFVRRLVDNLEANLRIVGQSAAALAACEADGPDATAVARMRDRAERAGRFYAAMTRLHARAVSRLGGEADLVALVESVAAGLDGERAEAPGEVR